MPRLLIILILCGLFTSSIAQTGSGYYIQEFTTDNGLPSNGIKGMQWDESAGFLWLATEAGVSRYNGLEFANFTKENTPGLSHERMAYMSKNIRGEIFVTDVNFHTCQVKDNLLIPVAKSANEPVSGFKRRYYFNIHNPILKNKVLPVMEETAKTIWENLLPFGDTSLLIVTARSEYYYVNTKNETAIHIPLKKRFRNRFMLENRLFLLDSLRRFYIMADEWDNPLPIQLQTKEGNKVDVNSENFLLFWDTGMKNPILFSGKNAWLLHYDDGLVAELICSEVPTSSFIRFAQYSEKYRLLFIGTDSKGMVVINQNRIRSLKNPNSDIRERNAYYSQVELPGEMVLTNESHVIGINPTIPADLPIKGKFDFSVHRLPDSTLWYCQFSPVHKVNVLHRYDYRSRETTVFGKISPTENFSIGEYKGNLYFATYEGLGRLEKDSLHFLFVPPVRRTLKDYYPAPTSMVQISPGIFAVASCDGLIFFDIENEKTDTIIRKDGYCIRSLFKYKDYLFIGSYGKGFFVWKNGILKPMPVDKNKFLLYTHCFMPDKEGFFWISTNRGLFKTQIADLLDAYENNRNEVYYHYYGKNDGMQITEMNGGCSPCALQLANNTISFPTMDGLLWVDPAVALPLLPAGDIYIDEFKAGDKTMNVDSLSQLSISPKANDISIRFGFSSWCNKENIYLEYRLNNDSAWHPIDINKGAFINLNNLGPGKYKLTIRKLNGFGIANYSYRELDFEISTPWTKQWWFYLLCAVVLFALVTVYLWFRTRQYKVRQRKLEKQVAEKTKELQEKNEVLEKNDTIKTRLISIISHDIVTPLKFLTTAGKNLQEKKQMMSEDFQQETLRVMTNTSQELQLLSTNILNWIKYQNENRRMMKEHFNLSDMVAQVLGLLQSLAGQKNLVIENNVDPDLMVHEYYEPMKILVYNLLTNAIHFTEKGIIEVNATQSNGRIIVSVKDQGVGMTPEQVQRILADEVVITSANVDNKKGHGLGFLIIKDLIKMMGASLNIKSEKGQGTEIFIQLQENNKPLQ